MHSKSSSYDMKKEDGQDASDTLLQQPPDLLDTQQKETPEKKDIKLVGPLEVFRYSDKWEKFLMIVGTFFCIAYGAPYPLFVKFWGESMQVILDFGKVQEFISTIPEFLDYKNLSKSEFQTDPLMLDESMCDDITIFYGSNVNSSCAVIMEDGIYDKMSELAINFCLLGINILVSGYIGTACWMVASERIAHRIRRSCLYNILSQHIGWFDTHEAAELNNRLSEDVVKIQDGIGEKMANLVQWMATSIASIVVGFIYGWKLALVIFGLAVLVVIVVTPMNKLSATLTARELSAYAKSGVIAEEVLGAIRTVAAFGGQEKEAVRYHKHLDEARWWAVKKNILHGIYLGTFNLLIYIMEAAMFLYGGYLHRSEPGDYTPKTVFLVFLCLTIGAYSIGNAAPSLQALSVARGAAYEVFKLIEMKSSIDSMSDEGKVPTDCKGVIEFSHVHFTYPARPDVKVLNDVNLKVSPGQTVSLVGASGCGKSTTVSLLLRFYDPDQGQILLDGCDIRELNTKWLRRNMGVVNQEPVLFATTISENIRHGRDDVTMEEMIAATKNANAFDFIMQLPNKFDTLVGERGARLSGGQKQRIAIARALVRDPKILLLDEATSSLDTESESIVQDALDKACQGRATFIIAHRLSTIRKADVIICYEDGKIVETGTHDTLIERQGIYHQLVSNQMIWDEDNVEGEVIAATTNLDLTTENNRQEKLLDIYEDGDKEEEKDEDLPKAPMLRLLKMNATEWYYIVLGCIASIATGCITPVFVILFANLFYVFSKDEETQKEEFLNFAIKLIILGCVGVVTYFLQAFMFGLSGEALTVRLRDQTFRAMMKQDISWFDKDKNGVGALTTRLSTDASQVHGVTGVKAGVMLMSLTIGIGSLIIAFTHGWKLTLLLLAFLPILAVGEIVKGGKMMAEQGNKNKEAFEGAGKITVETIGNIRTVASLSREKTFFNLYVDTIKGPYKSALRNVHIIAISFSFSQAAMYFFNACCFLLGAYLMEDGSMTALDFILVLGAVMMGSLAMGGAANIGPDVGKAQLSANRILHILDSKPYIDHTNPGGTKLKNDYQASVSLKCVNFHYPSRQTVPVLQELDLCVSPGQTLALVGSSGCGKSTTVQLLERFYDAISGMVCLDNNDVKTLNVEWLRSQMALVSQEPVLFDQSIGENIAFGDNSRDVPMDEIVEAARTANIHSFITSLPDGYDTNVGSKGTQLSGGQKQRIAIARALVRNPRILLLDEATSSLDTESEKIVQEALEKARVGRTCVVIAHRLATVQNADKICVIKDGRVTEEGTHSQLMATNGFYKKLVEKSMRTD